MSKKARKEGTRCPCGNAATYEHCCGRYHAGDAAPDAASLMRSRYSAFVLHIAPYLLDTWHRTRRPEAIDFDLQQKWLGLDLVRSATSETSA